MTIWIIETRCDGEAPFTFRILPGNIKTIGRATRADFIVDAGMVSRVHCRPTAGAAEVEVVDLDSTNGPTSTAYEWHARYSKMAISWVSDASPSRSIAES